MSTTLKVGDKRETTITVTDKDTAAQYGSGLAPVLSTPHVAGVFETVCKELLDAHVGAGQSSVGAAITVHHNAPTPVGMRVTFRVTVQAVEGRKVVFVGEAEDECEAVATCEHTRYVIDYARFMARVEGKTAKVAAAKGTTA